MVTQYPDIVQVVHVSINQRPSFYPLPLLCNSGILLFPKMPAMTRASVVMLDFQLHDSFSLGSFLRGLLLPLTLRQSTFPLDSPALAMVRRHTQRARMWLGDAIALRSQPGSRNVLSPALLPSLEGPEPTGLGQGQPEDLREECQPFNLVARETGAPQLHRNHVTETTP